MMGASVWNRHAGSYAHGGMMAQAAHQNASIGKLGQMKMEGKGRNLGSRSSGSTGGNAGVSSTVATGWISPVARRGLMTAAAVWPAMATSGVNAVRFGATRAGAARGTYNCGGGGDGGGVGARREVGRATIIARFPPPQASVGCVHACLAASVALTCSTREARREAFAACVAITPSL